MLSKTVAAALLGVSSFDVTDFTVTDIARSSNNRRIVTSTSSTGPSVLVSAVTKYLRRGSHYAPAMRQLQSTAESALVTCIVTLESSVYTYYETTQQFETSITDGTFNIWMRDYANYLQVYELNTTTIQSATYIDLSSEESDEEGKRSFFTPTNIVGFVIAAIVILCILAYACAWIINGGSIKDFSPCGSYRQNCKYFLRLIPRFSNCTLCYVYIECISVAY